jgi:hypothetical protein
MILGLQSILSKPSCDVITNATDNFQPSFASTVDDKICLNCLTLVMFIENEGTDFVCSLYLT